MVEVKEGLRRYPSYTPSTVPWLDEVPSNWKATRLDHLFKLRKEEPLEADGRVTGYLDGRVTLRSNVAGQKIKGVVYETGWQRIHVGDFAISGMNAHLGGMGVSDSEGKCSPIYIVLEPKTGTNAHFVSLAVRHAAHLGAIKALVQTIRFNSADMKRDDLKSIYVPVPSETEQAHIVRFVRTLDSKVNRLIKTKRRLIELLNEQKQAIIHRAVTRGLDPTVHLKPSGIEWLGDIPCDWQTHELRRLARFVSGGTPSKAEASYWTGDIPWVSPKDMKKPVIGDAIDHISEEGRASSGLTLLPVGALLIVVRGMILIRTVPVAITSAPVTINQDMKGLLIDKRRVHPEFLYIVLRAAEPAISAMVEMSGHGTRKLVTERLARLKLPIPDLDTQAAMIAAITSDTQAVDAAIGKTQSEIDFIREYRTRLVADVVTGQLDVRHLDLPDVGAQTIANVDVADETDEHLETLEPEFAEA